MKTRTIAILAASSLLLPVVLGLAVLLLLSSKDAEIDPRPSGLDSRFEIDELVLAGPIHTMAFSPDGKFLAAGSKETGRTREGHWNGELKVWNVSTRSEANTLCLSQWVKWLTFSPKGDLLAVAASSANLSAPDGFLNFVQKPGEISVFEFPSMKEKTRFELDGLVEKVLFTPDSKGLAVLHTVDPKSRGPSNVVYLSLDSKEKTVLVTDVWGDFLFSHDGKDIFAGSALKPLTFHPENFIIKVFDSQKGSEKRSLGGIHPVYAGSMNIFGDGILIVLGRGVFLLQDVKMDVSANELSRFLVPSPFPTYFVTSATFSPKMDKILATVSRGPLDPRSKVLLEDLRAKELITVFEDPASKVIFQRCAFSPDNRTFAVGTNYYQGIHGKEGDPMHGRVLLFRPREK